MAKVTSRTVVVEPAKPAVIKKRFFLELDEEEMAILRTLLGRVTGPHDDGGQTPTYPIYSALDDAGASWSERGASITVAAHYDEEPF